MGDESPFRFILRNTRFSSDFGPRRLPIVNWSGTINADDTREEEAPSRMDSSSEPEPLEAPFEKPRDSSSENRSPPLQDRSALRCRLTRFDAFLSQTLLPSILDPYFIDEAIEPATERTRSFRRASTGIFRATIIKQQHRRDVGKLPKDPIFAEAALLRAGRRRPNCAGM